MGDYLDSFEIDDLRAKCPKCGNTKDMELCDLHPKDGDEFDWQCDMCGLACTVTFCEQYWWRTELKEAEKDGNE